MTWELQQQLDAALSEFIITPTPYLPANGTQGGRNFLRLTPLERQEIIRRIEELND